MTTVLNSSPECVKLLNVSFHSSIHRPVSNATSTNTCIDCFDMRTIECSLFSTQCIDCFDMNKTNQIQYIFDILFNNPSHPPVPSHRVPFATRTYSCGTRYFCLDLRPPLYKIKTKCYVQNKRNIHPRVSLYPPPPEKHVHR